MLNGHSLDTILPCIADHERIRLQLKQEPASWGRYSNNKLGMVEKIGTLVGSE
jgi:hypothetical protein